MKLQNKNCYSDLLWPMICFGYGLATFNNLNAIVIAIILIITVFFIHQNNKLSLIFSTITLFCGILIGNVTNQEIQHFNQIIGTTLDLQIIKTATKNNKTKTIFGTAKILKIHARYSNLTNKTCYFILSNNRSQPAINNGIITAKANITFASPKSRKTFLQYIARNNIKIYVSNGEITHVKNNNNSLNKFFNDTKLKIICALEKGISDKNKSHTNILIGMLTGQKTEITPLQKKNFTDNGVAHVFAVSGLHIGIITSVIHFLCKLLHINRKIRFIPVLLILVLYINIIGAPASALRATTMVVFYYLSILTNRKPNIFAALINSCFLWLILNPQNIFDISFLMSHVIVAGLLVLSPVINDIITRILKSPITLKQRKQKLSIKQKLKCLIIGSISTSCAAELVAAPLSIEYFGQISKFSIIINALVIPLASIAIISGTISLISTLLHAKILTIMFNNVAVFIIKIIENILNIPQNGAIKFHHQTSGFGLLTSICILISIYFIIKIKYNTTLNSQAGTIRKPPIRQS